MTGPRRLEKKRPGLEPVGEGAHKKITFALDFVLVGGKKKRLTQVLEVISQTMSTIYLMDLGVK